MPPPFPPPGLSVPCYFSVFPPPCLSDEERGAGSGRMNSKDAVHEYVVEHCFTLPCDPFSVTATSGFVERGLIKYKKSKRHDDYVTIPTNEPLSSDAAQSIAALDIYTVRLVCRTSSACETSPLPLFSSINACRLGSSQYKDNFVLHLGTDGNLVSFEYNADGDDVCLAESSSNTEISIRTSALISRPKEMEVMEPKVDEGPMDEKGQPLKGKAPEGPGGVFGFFQRYWYIIVPMMILQLAGGAAEPPSAKAATAAK